MLKKHDTQTQQQGKFDTHMTNKTSRISRKKPEIK